MSELTECNYCTLKKLESRFGTENIKVVPGIGDFKDWWVAIRNAGTPNKPMWTSAGYSFAVVTAHCVC